MSFSSGLGAMPAAQMTVWVRRVPAGFQSHLIWLNFPDRVAHAQFDAALFEVLARPLRELRIEIVQDDAVMIDQRDLHIARVKVRIFPDRLLQVFLELLATSTPV